MRPAGATPPALADGEIHVWRLDLSEPPADGAEDGLDARERERARRFAFERDRVRYRRAHAGLRGVLSLYLGIPARQVALVLTGEGKPILDAASGPGFNLSHSGDLALVAVGSMPHVGVDIEELRGRAGMRDIAAEAFTDGENAALAGFAQEALVDPFLACWTRKEACLKALGTGLATDPRSLEVGLGPARLRIVLGPAAPGACVEVETIAHDSRCVAALAAVGGFRRHRLLRWEGWQPSRVTGP